MSFGSAHEPLQFIVSAGGFRCAHCLMRPLLIAALSGIGALFVWVSVLALIRRRLERATRMPVAKRYLRPAGESLRRRLDAMLGRLDAEILLVPAAAFLFALGVFAFGAGEKPVGRLLGLIGAAALVLLLLRFKRHAQRIADQRLGFLGRRAVGEELNQLRADGWSIFHDVPFDGKPGAGAFHVDHVVVGPRGVYAIGIRTTRPRRAADGSEVVFDGRFLHFPSGKEFLGPDDLRFHAKTLAAWLSESLQREVWVVPVMVLAGWRVRCAGDSDLRVVSDAELASLFREGASPDVLDPSAVGAIRALLEDRCRDVTLD